MTTLYNQQPLQIITRSPDEFNLINLPYIPTFDKPTPDMLVNYSFGLIFPTAELTIDDIAPLVYCFDYPIIMEQQIFNDIKNSIYSIITTTNINNTQIYKANDIKLALFNIYDNGVFFNSKYGSTYNEFLKTAYSFNDLLIRKGLDVPLYFNSTLLIMQHV